MRGAEQIRAGAERLEVELTAALSERLYEYVRLLKKWSKKVNLVGPLEESELIELHVLDSLALLAHLDLGQRLVDVGSGAGLPGAVLALARPDLVVTSLEPIHKKHAFQCAVRRELALDNFTPLAERDQEHLASGDRARYEAAVSRATWPVDQWLVRAEPLVRPGGRILGMEARPVEPLPAGTTRHPYQLGQRTRAVLVRPLPAP